MLVRTKNSGMAFNLVTVETAKRKVERGATSRL